MAREKLKVDGTVQDMLMQMADGNIGALTLLIRIFKEKPNDAFIRVLDLDDMNIRGPMIWLGFKDHCGQDLDRFLQAVEERDPAMVQTINQNIGPGERAVVSGASY